MEKLRELVVPGVMLAAIGLYLWDAAGLSAAALILPYALIAVTVATLAWFLLAFHLRGHAPGDSDEEVGPILEWKPWLLVLLPAAAVLLWDYLGALPALIVLVFAGQMVFGLRAPLRGLAIAIAVTLPVYGLFKFVLYARFPAGMLGLG